MNLNLTYKDYWSIRIDLLFYDREILDSEKQRKLLFALGDFMRERGQWKKISLLRSDPITNPDYHIKNQIRDMEMNGFYFGMSTYYEDNEPVGVLLDQNINILRNESPKWFSKLFPYRLLQVSIENRKWVQDLDAESRINSFLQYHLKENFDNDLKKFSLFLSAIKASTNELIKDFDDFIEIWKNEQDNQSKSTGDFTVIQHAMSLYYKQAAGTYPHFTEGKKIEELGKLTKEYGIASEKKFQQQYNKISKKGSQNDRLKILKKEINRNSVMLLLKKDSKALAELKIEIDKACNPIT